MLCVFRYWKDACTFCHCYSIPVEKTCVSPIQSLPTTSCGVSKPNLVYVVTEASGSFTKLIADQCTACQVLICAQ